MSEITQAVDTAVAERFDTLRPGLRTRTGDYLYTNSRCRPTELGWRFRQNLSIKLREPAGIGWQPPAELVDEVRRGEHDKLIEATWHDAASAGHWYTFEKDYGRDDPEPEYLDEDSYGDDMEEEDEEGDFDSNHKEFCRGEETD